MIILDCGSGNSCKNSIDYACKMVKSIVDLNLQNVIIKWQLFTKAGNNITLSHEVFERAYRYAAILGIRTTASIFDKKSKNFSFLWCIICAHIVNWSMSFETSDNICRHLAMRSSASLPLRQPHGFFTCSVLIIL